MAQRPARFKQADVMRAIKGALQAGLQVASARIEHDSAIHLIFGAPQSVASSNPWDKELGCHGRH